MSYLVKEKTRQTYSYDNLYQLIKVEGETTYDPYRSSVPEFVSNYSQDFEFDTDGLGNMISKVSKESVQPQKKIGDNLNYNFTYVYDENYAHRLVRAGDRYYKYDSNGNIICEQDGSFESNGNDTAYHKIEQETDDVYSTDYGWGLFKEDKTGSTTSRYRRTYIWNERNQLISSVDANYSTAYVYGQDGQRSNKYTGNSETLYFNKMWTHHTDSGNSIYGGQTSKNIYLGETRIVTKLNSGEEPTYQEEYYKQYYYHSDHLGSASMISDYKGDEYQRIEYTPYGETWIEKTSNTGLEYLPYKFTAKELDEETGLYYYGARYLDPKYSMWISTDPALAEYIPMAPISEEARNHNQNLPGLGGVFNSVNLNLYHYAANNPVKYVDPDGEAAWTASMCWLTVADGPFPVGDIIYGIGVTVELIGLAYVANKYSTKTCDVAIPQTQTKAKEQTQDSNAIRFQLQTGSDTPASAVRVSNDKLGVKKQEAYGALAELYSTAIAKEPGLAKCKDFTSAIVRMSEAVKSTQGIATGGNVMREKFSYQGKEYRIDLENLRGINLVE